MFTLNDISVYIYNWKKVSNNSLTLHNNIIPIIKNTFIINCDENFKLNNNINSIQLDDSHYFGSQYNHSIKHVKKGSIFCIIVGDNIPNNDFNKIFNNALNAFNNYNIGIYSPNDKRSQHKTKLNNINENLFNVINTDCGFWFIHPQIVNKMRSIDYTISKYGWGIDIITIKEAKKQNLLVIRDYSVETDQLDHSCGYNKTDASKGIHLLEELYNKI